MATDIMYYDLTKLYVRVCTTRLHDCLSLSDVQWSSCERGEHSFVNSKTLTTTSMINQYNRLLNTFISDYNALHYITLRPSQDSVYELNTRIQYS